MSAVIAANPVRSDTVVRLPNSGSQPLSSSTLMGHFSYRQLSPNQGTAMDLFLLHHWLRQALPRLRHLLLYTGGSPQDCRFFSLPGVSAGQVSALSSGGADSPAGSIPPSLVVYHNVFLIVCNVELVNIHDDLVLDLSFEVRFAWLAQPVLPPSLR